MTFIEIQLDQQHEFPPEMFVVPVVFWGENYQKYTIQLDKAEVFYLFEGEWRYYS